MRPPVPALLRTFATAMLVAVPLLLAVAGPLLAPEPGDRGRPFTSGAGVWGTDFVGRDVGTQILLGGWSIVTTALVATVLAYLLGVPLGMLAAMARRRWLDEALMRPLDVVQAIPSLLLMLLLASVAPAGGRTVIGIVALINLPDVARISRAAALDVARRTSVEAMWMQGEGWVAVAVGYIGRTIVRTLAADAGIRAVGAFYLVAAASFLGVGTGPDSADWAVMVDVNRAGIFISPWGVLVPALLLVALSMGLNLTFDGLLSRRRRMETSP